MALIFDKRLVVLHVPKTGGLWVTEVLKQSGFPVGNVSHIHSDFGRTLRALNPLRSLGQDVTTELKRHVGAGPKRIIRRVVRARTRPDAQETDESWFGMRWACFVRHPLSWYESWWRYGSHLGWPGFGTRGDVYDWHPMAALNGLGHTDFNQFMGNVLRHAPGFVSTLYDRFAPVGVPVRVGQQEHLGRDLRRLLESIGVELPTDLTNLDRVNRSPGDQVEWSRELREETCRLEYVAIRRFGYDVADLEDPRWS